MGPVSDNLARAVTTAARRRLAESLDKIKHCVGQLSDEQLWWRPQPAMNSIANIILHLSGNVQQWLVCGITGETDTRNRPREFAERGPLPKSDLVGRLEEVVTRADGALEFLGAGGFLEERRIQGFDTTALAAVFDCVAHFNGHTQEIVYATRLQLGHNYHVQWSPATPEQGAEP
jgi:hypothetical protein